MKKVQKTIPYLLIAVLLGYGVHLKFQLLDSRDGILNGTYVSQLIEVKDGVTYEKFDDLVYLAFKAENSDLKREKERDANGLFWIYTPTGRMLDEGTYEREEDDFYRLTSNDGEMFGYVTFKGRHRLQLVNAEAKTMKLYHQVSQAPGIIRPPRNKISQSNNIHP